MAELPLVIFTLCMQAAIGTVVFMMVTKQVQKEQEFKKAALVAAILAVVGVLASLIHLGTPTLALNSLLNVASSWLSREILFSGAFMGLVVLYAFLLYKGPTAKSTLNAMGWIASLVGLADVFMMAKVYTTSSIAAWQGTATYIEFYATIIVLGAAILLITSVKAMDRKLIATIGISVLFAVAIQAVFTVLHYLDLGLMGGAGAASAELLADKSILVIVQWLLLIFGTGALLFSKIVEGKSTFTKYYVTATALSIGFIVGRYLFYAVSVASRVGLT